MALETGTYISDLDPANPVTGDLISQGDDHLRLIKSVLKNTFPALNGPLSAALVPFTASGNIAASSVQAAIQELDTEKAKLAGGNSFTGVQTFGAATRSTRSAIAASAIDCSLGDIFTRTISGNITFTVSNAAASGSVTSFILDLTNGGSATITWWSGVKWAGGVAPVLTAAGRDVLGFFTHDGGTTWTGLVLGKDVK